QDGKHVLTLQTYNSEEDNAPAGGVWRTLLMAQDVALSTTRLSRLQGEVIVYPHAKLATLDFPMAARTPPTLEAEGVRATLKQVKVRPGVVSAVVAAEWASGLSVSRVNPEAPYGITALTRAGAVVAPSGGGSSSGSSPAGARGPTVRREYSV